MKVFYSDYSRNKEVSSSNPIEMDLEEALQSFSSLSGTKESFWGLEIGENRTLHFKYNDPNSWVAHIPSQELQGSHLKTCTQEECLSLIRDVFNRNDLIVPKGFEFEKW